MAALQQVICVIENRSIYILKKKLCKENAENLP